MLLSKETFFIKNRVSLIAILILSLLIPLISLPTYIATTPISAISIHPIQTVVHQYRQINAMVQNTMGLWALGLLGIYAIGIFVQFAISIWSMVQLYRILIKARIISYKNYRIAITKHDQDPFSWGRYIVISEYDYKNEPELIIQHELVHLERKHFYDLLLLEFLIILFWFNPIIRMVKKELKDIHEYEVDDCLLHQGIDAKAYQLLLIRRAVGSKIYILANSFNQTFVGKRINMMLKKKSSPWAQLKYVCIALLMFFSLFIFAKNDLNAELSQLTTKKIGKIIKQKTGNKTPEKQNLVAHVPIPDSKLRQTNLPDTEQKQLSQPPLCVVNGRETSYTEFRLINANAIEKVHILKGSEARRKYGIKARYGAIEVQMNEKIPATVPQKRSESIPNQDVVIIEEPLFVFFVDGEKAEDQQSFLKEKDKLMKNSQAIESIVSIYGKAAAEKYGEEGKNGVCEIYLKK
jgi:Antirepressor regulating drug resistance, predicted signal transduction N-terminal membrane component